MTALCAIPNLAVTRATCTVPALGGECVLGQKEDNS
jgi:hypothetical protein